MSAKMGISFCYLLVEFGETLAPLRKIGSALTLLLGFSCISICFH